jgi:hypothetical protein
MFELAALVAFRCALEWAPSQRCAGARRGQKRRGKFGQVCPATLVQRQCGIGTRRGWRRTPLSLTTPSRRWEDRLTRGFP